MHNKGGVIYPKRKKGENKGVTKREKGSKKARIIIRNLPFKNLSETTLKDLFSEYGEIEEVKLLRKDDGKFVGCGFIQFKRTSSAAKAIHYSNQKEINGRKIILDWALPKDTYLKKIEELNEKISTEKDDKFYIDKDGDPSLHNSEYDSDADEKKDVNIKKEYDGEDEKDTDISLKDEDCSDDSNCEENEIKQEDWQSSDEEQADLKCKRDSRPQSEAQSKPSDAEDGKTVFIRNLPFSATNDDLRECIEKYGAVEYALICIDKLTEHSKGTAFVRFKNPESASQCVKDSMKLHLQGNALTVNFALSKERVQNKKSNKKVTKDSRNLYLIREGVVVAGSKAASGVSASDMSKRLQLEQWKSQILKNLNMVVSRTRLVIHNLPPSYDDAKLKKLFIKHSNPKAIIKEAKVMWEKNKLDALGKHISKEVGFVSFTNHEDALTALRNINNNPAIFTPKKRPIVAFSIENKLVLNQKQNRIQKSRMKLGITVTDKMSNLNRKQRRFIKRRQKIIDNRREAKKLKQDQSSAEDVKQKVEPVSDHIKRKAPPHAERDVARKKLKTNRSDTRYRKEPESQSFSGIASEPGKKVKLRSRFNLKKQAVIHNQTLKKEKFKRKQNTKIHLEPIKQPRQKQGKRKLLDDEKLSKIISRHREDIQKSSIYKKWYET